ncbi:DEAD/DEAH box helicase [Marinicella meishanensis]|uniref:DEAD/DEAH box helicase n=1 Tax=Marinicella meishanensis TaxID=2873263 RepID=UPI001CBEAE34|nr:DEAD/DEAH box helicase [Marinicella sp. NBU2979]
MSANHPPLDFTQLGLSDAVLQAVQDNGYEQPSPIQQACIPPILAGQDVLGQAQTGTGKTAAFALPIISRLKPKKSAVQVLVLTPTRELAIQVAEAFQAYARHTAGFSVLAVYGGQSYDGQLKKLKRGVQVVVGTPGRVMDHMRRKTLQLDQLDMLVLDEADEMLRMGFIDDVNWILSHTPDGRQIALFSATMPKAIKQVAVNHLQQPVDIKIKAKTTTAKNIRQRFWLVSGMPKLEALSRLLEVEKYAGVLVFVRTKMATEEVAEKLQARGFAAEALNGDMVQKQRERLVSKLKSGATDILIGTDVVARGLDVDRISHVINYDVPYDTESYVHRIGRTGRAGRSGEAILFITKREQRMLKMIEKATNQPIERMTIPSIADINESRQQRFKEQLLETLASQDLSAYQAVMAAIEEETAHSPSELAAAMAHLLHGDQGMLLTESAAPQQAATHARIKAAHGHLASQPEPLHEFPDIPMERFVLAVGRSHGVTPSQVVGMICNEAELDRVYVGQIDIHEQVTTVDLPADMPPEILAILRRAMICGRRSGMQSMVEFQSAGQSAKSAHKPSEQRRRRQPKKNRKFRKK